MINDDSKYIGNGLNFPLRTDSSGKIKLVTGSTDIEQAIHIILETSPGERVMRPLFGCKAREMVFEMQNSETFTLMASHIKEALTMWEPRIILKDVQVGRDDQYEGAVVCKIEYEINATHDERNIVHPFYIEKEPEVD